MRRILAALAAVLTVAGLGFSAPLMVSAAASGGGVTKTVVIFEENHSYSQIRGNSQMPYLNSLADSYGDVHLQAVPPTSSKSLPSYLAMTFGSTFGVTDDGSPAKHAQPGPTIYSQVPDSASFAESMPSNCAKSDGPKTDNGTDGSYAVRHAPWAYQTDSTRCATADVPYTRSHPAALTSAISAGLGAFTSISPGICNELHAGTFCQMGGQSYYERADDYLHWLIPLLQGGPDWQQGKLAIWVVFDEGTDNDNDTLGTVLANGMSHVTDQMDSYDALRTWEDTAGVGGIRNSVGATSHYADLFGGSAPPTSPPPSSPPPSSPPPSSPPPSSPPPSQGALKHTAQGLLDRQGSPKVNAVKDLVAGPTWAQVEPQQGVFDFSTIDAYLANVPDGYAAKLRVSAGPTAPQWVMNDAGTFQITDISQSGTGSKMTLPKFWTQAYADDWAGLQAALAARYDDNAKIGVVASNLCVMQFDEPYLRDASDSSNRQALLDAGYTVAADNQCHDTEMSMPLSVWHQTKVEITFNPFQHINPDGTVTQDLDYALAQMDQWKSEGGDQAELANYSLSASRINDSSYSQIYAKIKAYGAPSSIQTATNAKIGDPNTVLDFACNTLKVNSVELPSGYNGWSGVDFAGWDSCLRGNPDPTGSTSPSPSPSPSPSESPSPSPSESPSPSPTGSPSPSESPSPSQSPTPPPAGDPAVTTEAPSDITDTTATVSCSVDPDGADTDVWLNWRLDSGKWGDASTVNSDHATVTAADGPTEVDFDMTGLTGQTAFRARCKASNSASDADGHSPVTGGEITFTTDPTPTDPSVTTGSVDAVEVLCPVDPGGADTLVWVTWKLSSDPWSSDTTTHTTAQSVLGSQAKPYAVPFLLTGLPAASSIDMRCKASNSVSDADGDTPIVGATQTFVTP